MQAPPLPLQLILEVVQQLQRMFQPDVKIIKRCIENLIDVSAAAAGCRNVLWRPTYLNQHVLSNPHCCAWGTQPVAPSRMRGGSTAVGSRSSCEAL